MNSCNHPEEKQILIVTDAFAGYEVTRVKCIECEEFISDADIDVVV